MSGTYQLHKAIEQYWFASELDQFIASFWSSEVRGSDAFLTLNEAEVAPGTPQPYVVYAIQPSSTVARMSGHHVYDKRQIERYPVTFEIFASGASGKSAKMVAGEVLEKVLAHFGGSSDVRPKVSLDMSPSCLVNAQYVNDYGSQEDETVYKWTVDYSFVVDNRVLI